MTEARAYSLADVLRLLHLTHRTFRRQFAAGKLPMCVLITPRISRSHYLFRADVLDSYLRGDGLTLRRAIDRHKRPA